MPKPKATSFQGSFFNRVCTVGWLRFTVTSRCAPWGVQVVGVRGLRVHRTPSFWGLLANGTGAGTVPADGTLVQWDLFGPLPTGQTSVDVVVGGHAKPLPARVTPD